MRNDLLNVLTITSTKSCSIIWDIQELDEDLRGYTQSIPQCLSPQTIFRSFEPRPYLIGAKRRHVFITNEKEWHSE